MNTLSSGSFKKFLNSKIKEIYKINKVKFLKNEIKVIDI